MTTHRHLGRPASVVVVWALACLPLSLADDVEHTFVQIDGQMTASLRHSFPATKTGDVTLGGAAFHVTGKRVRVPPGKKCTLALPEAKCAGVHILHYLEHSGGEIGFYVLTFADDRRVEVSVVCGLGIHDWWKPQPLPYASIAHQDTFPWRDQKQPVAFWRFSVRNPRPEAPVKSIEVVNTHTLAVINVIAITLSSEMGPMVGGTPVFDPTASEEQRLVDVLRFKTKALGKGEVCEQLKMTGTRESVAALAELLDDEQWSHAARFALEAMPYPEAGAVLREALKATSGKTKVGIIESLGERRAQASVPALAPLVSDSDPAIAAAAATALGKIGGPEAVRILRTAKAGYSERRRIPRHRDSGRGPGDADPGPNSGEFGYPGSASAIVRQAISQALLACAEQLLNSDRTLAREVYRELFTASAFRHVRTAAYRGLILAAGDKRASLVTSALTGSDHAAKTAALPFVREMKGVEATQAFAALLDRVPPETQVAVIAALGQRGDTAAATAISRATQSKVAGVRCAAYRSLTLCGDASVVPALARAAARAEGSERKAAMGALTRLRGPGVSEAIQSHLPKASAPEKAVLASALGARRSTGAAPALLELARDETEPVRLAAIGSLGEVADAATVGKLVELLRDARSADERSAAERAITAVGLRARASPQFIRSVLAGVRHDDPAVRCAMLRVCSRFRNAQLLGALKSSARDGNAGVRDAAARAIAGSPDPAALPHLLTVAKEAEEATHRVLALRGFARLIGEAGNLDDGERDRMLRDAMGLAKRPEDKKLILGRLGRSPTLAALELGRKFLDDPDVAAEAAAACMAIAKPLRDAHPDEVQAACRSVLEHRRIPGDLRKAAADLLRVTSATSAAAEDVRFEKIVVDRQFRSEGVAVADVNRDGRNDILAGDVWYAAPDWKMREVRPVGKYSPDRGYSRCFANFALDVDGDGWTDSIVIGFPGAPAHWYQNPRGEGRRWKERRLVHSACNETPLFAGLLGEDKPVLVFGIDGRLNWLGVPENLDQQWRTWPISETTPAAKKFGHGLGVGDVNGDGRSDVVATEGWWEAPEDRTQPDWKFHKVSLGPACANMLICDVDGDGDSDIVTSSAHRYGIWWFEQHREGFRQHEIHKGISQTHALILADVNSDGLQDLVTGKRYHAHNGKDPGSAEPAVVCWLELRRPPGGKPEFVLHEIDSDSGVGTQFEVCDFDGDGLLDVVTSNKKGVYSFLQRRNE